MTVDITCDECGRRTDDVICKICYRALSERIEELETEVDGLRQNIDAETLRG